MLSIQYSCFHDQYYDKVYENKSQGNYDFFAFVPSPFLAYLKKGMKAFYNTLTL